MLIMKSISAMGFGRLTGRDIANGKINSLLMPNCTVFVNSVP